MKRRWRLLLALILAVNVSVTQVGCNKKFLKKMKKILKQVVQVLATFQIGLGGFLGKVQEIKEKIDAGKQLAGKVKDFGENVREDITRIRDIKGIANDINEFGDSLKPPRLSRNPEGEETVQANDTRSRTTVPERPGNSAPSTAPPPKTSASTSTLPTSASDRKDLLDRLAVAEELARQGITTAEDLKNYLRKAGELNGDDDDDDEDKNQDRKDQKANAKKTGEEKPSPDNGSQTGERKPVSDLQPPTDRIQSTTEELRENNSWEIPADKPEIRKKYYTLFVIRKYNEAGARQSGKFSPIPEAYPLESRFLRILAEGGFLAKDGSEVTKWTPEFETTFVDRKRCSRRPPDAVLLRMLRVFNARFAAGSPIPEGGPITDNHRKHFISLRVLSIDGIVDMERLKQLEDPSYTPPGR